MEGDCTAQYHCGAGPVKAAAPVDCHKTRACKGLMNRMARPSFRQKLKNDDDRDLQTS